MKQSLSVFATIFFVALTTSNPSFATSVVNVIGNSPISVGMGGTGVALPMTSGDALYKNPSLLGNLTTRTGEWAFDATLGLVSQNAATNFGTGPVASASGAYFAPNISGTYRLSERFALGLGILPYAGATADYTGVSSALQVKQSLALIKFTPAISYSGNGWSIGVAPYMTMGRFALNESAESVTGAQSTRSPSSAIGLGAQIGASVQPLAGVTFGASYTSKSNFNYKSLVCVGCLGPSTDIQAAATAGFPVNDVTIQQPDEIALGVSVAATSNLDVTFDYRNIGWSRSDGYKDFSFATQNVFAVGAQYRVNKLTLRAGFNYAASPLADRINETGETAIPFQGRQISAQAQSILDSFAFPGISQTHITLGTGYTVNEHLSVDLSGYYAPKVTLTRSGSTLGALQAAGFPNKYSYSTSVTQWAINGGATYRF